MEYTTRFTMICKDQNDSDALHAIFGAAKPDVEALASLLRAKKVSIYAPDDFDPDHYQRAGLVIDASFTSGSASVSEFIAPLAKLTSLMQAEIVDDEVANRLRYGFINGKRATSDDVIALMKSQASVEQLGRVGRIIQTREEAENNPSIALGRAIANKAKIDVVRTLLEKGADPNSLRPIGYSCLNGAVTNKSVQIVKLLLEAGADPDFTPKGSPCLYEACRYGAPKIVAMLLAHGADPNRFTNGYFCYPIEQAIAAHLADSVKQLLAHGAKTSGLRKMRNLLELNAGEFHDNYSGELDAKLAIFRLLLQVPELIEQFQKSRARILELLNEGFKAMEKTPKNQDDFANIVRYIETAHQ
ncbi:MAG TPA: ankyrin repeat domain-containing protein [Pseudoduganella sp.]